MPGEERSVRPEVTLPQKQVCCCCGCAMVDEEMSEILAPWKIRLEKERYVWKRSHGKTFLT